MKYMDFLKIHINLLDKIMCLDLLNGKPTLCTRVRCKNIDQCMIRWL